MLEKYLQEIGLNEKEAVVYLFLLTVDGSSVLDISKKTKINRSTTYIVLESLAKKGLVSETTIGKKTHFQAEQPERLETYIEQRKILLEEQSKKLKDIIPQIKSVQRESGEKPIVQYFEGKEGIFALNESLFKDNEEKEPVAYSVYSKNLLDEVFPEQERARFKKERIKKNIKNKTIYTWTNGKIPTDAMSDRVKLDASKYPIYCDISILGDRIRIGILGKKLSGIFIKSPDLASTLKSILDALFDYLKKEEPGS
ncbi:MAG: helix-turn-helix domain-containing protein [Candidatus Taylorbacteria bacterium]